jgi:hypothetical protein
LHPRPSSGCDQGGQQQTMALLEQGLLT